jgi:hypothetical protein
MKIRIGFVSNSSSSSFLVGLKQKPRTRGELRDLMFGELEGDVVVYDDSLSIDNVVCRVFNDLKDKTPMTKSWAQALSPRSNEAANLGDRARQVCIKP